MGLFGRAESAKSREKEAKGQHTDPVCGMAVVEERAFGPETLRGEAHWFCSVECQDQFQEREGLRRGEREEPVVR